MSVGGVDAAAIQQALEILGPLAQTNVNLGVLTTYRVGGDTALYIEAQTEQDLEAVSRVRNETDLPTLIIGKGSNLLVADTGFPGVTVAIGKLFETITMDRETATVYAGSTVALPSLARQSVASGLTGFEWAVGVPGSIGGAVRMNAGGHGGDMAAVVTEVNMFDLRTSRSETKTKEDMTFSYRKSAVTQDLIVLGATLQLERDDTASGAKVLSEIVQWRRANQPGGQNAGSVFVNPQEETSGELLDRLGFKGFRIGSAQVSAKHANFVQADPGGSASDVDAVITAIASRVLSETGISLRTEIQRIGFEG